MCTCIINDYEIQLICVVIYHTNGCNTGCRLTRILIEYLFNVVNKIKIKCVLMYRKWCLYIVIIYLTKYYVLLFLIETLVFCHLWSHTNNDLSSIIIIRMESREREKWTGFSAVIYMYHLSKRGVCYIHVPPVLKGCLLYTCTTCLKVVSVIYMYHLS